MKTRAIHIAGLGGLVLISLLIAHAGFSGVMSTLGIAGWSLLLLIPFHLLHLALDAVGWHILLGDRCGRATFTYLVWGATIRESVNNLLPVARVGGELVGIRLIILRQVKAALAAASVLVEVTLNLISQYLFALAGLALWLQHIDSFRMIGDLLLALALALPVLIVLVALQRYGNIFTRLERHLPSLAGGSDLQRLVGSPAALDVEIRGLYARHTDLIYSLLWQFTALLSVTLETWFTLYLLGHPVSLSAALLIESISQALRNAAFLVPAGLGVQEASLVFLGDLAGLSPEISIALALAKRFREVALGLPALLSWQIVEGKRLSRLLRHEPRDIG